MIIFFTTVLALASAPSADNGLDAARGDTNQFQEFMDLPLVDVINILTNDGSSKSVLGLLRSVRDEISDGDLPIVDVINILTDSGSSESVLRLLRSVRDELSDGDRRRFAPLNLAYQLACYQGVGGIFHAQARWAMEKYTNYGCYCNRGTYSGRPLDATDKCCQTHESCYNRVMAKYKLNRDCQPYTVQYHVSCCEDQKHTMCSDYGPSAGRELCECDQAMASCVAKSVDSYNEELVNNRDQCNQDISTKPLTAMEMLDGCRHDSSSAVGFQITYGSQGTCGE